LFTDDDQMARLNEKYLGRKGPTNVMAFPMEGGPAPVGDIRMLGDVVISVETALRESEQVEEEPERTVDRLLIHGLLHLLGYNHEASPAESKRMEQEEEKLLDLMRED
jgi:rRNA maturation RNase YbeY